MANQFAVMPYTLTGVMAATLKNTANAGFGNGGYITKILWQNPPAAGSFVLVDGHGNALATIATTPGGSDIDTNFIPPLPFIDFQCTTFSAGGTVFIYTI
jgi:hypothetical protein